MKIKPLLDRVVIQQDEAQNETSSGIIIPDNAKEKPKCGTVIACGDGKVNTEGVIIPMTVKVGHKVLYEKYAGTEIKVEGKLVVIMKESDIFAIV